MKDNLFVSYDFAPLRPGRIFQSLAFMRDRIALVFNKYRAVVTAHLAGITNNSVDSRKETDKIKPSTWATPNRIDWLLHSSIVGKLKIINPKPAAL